MCITRHRGIECRACHEEILTWWGDPEIQLNAHGYPSCLGNCLFSQWAVDSTTLWVKTQTCNRCIDAHETAMQSTRRAEVLLSEDDHWFDGMTDYLSGAALQEPPPQQQEEQGPSEPRAAHESNLVRAQPQSHRRDNTEFARQAEMLRLEDEKWQRLNRTRESRYQAASRAARRNTASEVSEAASRSTAFQASPQSTLSHASPQSTLAHASPQSTLSQASPQSTLAHASPQSTLSQASPQSTSSQVARRFAPHQTARPSGAYEPEGYFPGDSEEE